MSFSLAFSLASFPGFLFKSWEKALLFIHTKLHTKLKDNLEKVLGELEKL